MAETPTSRSLAECRKRGWTAQVVERWNPYAKVRIDLFGFLDIVALTPEGILGIQATSNDNVAARVAKIREAPTFPAWVAAGGQTAVWGWAKKGPRGSRKQWALREVEVTRCESP